MIRLITAVMITVPIRSDLTIHGKIIINKKHDIMAIFKKYDIIYPIKIYRIAKIISKSFYSVTLFKKGINDLWKRKTLL